MTPAKNPSRRAEPDPAGMVRLAPGLSAHVQVRLTPGDRARAATVLHGRLGTKRVTLSPVTGRPTSFRSCTTHEAVLLDCVRYGSRGWSVVMPPTTAAEIAAKLTRSTAADIGRRFAAAAQLLTEGTR